MKCEYEALLETDYKSGKQMYSEKSLSKFKICYCKSPMDWAVTKSDLRGYGTLNNHLSYGTVITLLIPTQIVAFLDVTP
jgi:hypothetical protein